MKLTSEKVVGALMTVIAVAMVTVSLVSFSTKAKKADATVKEGIFLLDKTEIELEPGRPAVFAVICDKPRGNLVYLTKPKGSDNVSSVGITHQPDLCANVK